MRNFALVRCVQVAAVHADEEEADTVRGHGAGRYTVGGGVLATDVVENGVDARLLGSVAVAG